MNPLSGQVPWRSQNGKPALQGCVVEQYSATSCLQPKLVGATTARIAIAGHHMCFITPLIEFGAFVLPDFLSETRERTRIDRASRLQLAFGMLAQVPESKDAEAVGSDRHELRGPTAPGLAPLGAGSGFRWSRLPAAFLVAMTWLVGATGCDPGSRCGPTEGTVARVIDGDTVELESGERVRYLMIDTPEITGGKNDCYGAEARSFNEDLVLGKNVHLRYDVECEDQFGRLLAYVSVGGREVNSLMVERGYACLLSIPPNGQDRFDEFDELEAAAKSGMRGMWGACTEVTCD